MSAVSDRTLLPRVLTISGLVLLAAASRLLPHPPNATPLLAVGLFGGAYFTDRRWAFLVPLGAMAISDVGLWMIEGYGLLTPMRAVVYACLLAASGIGIWGLDRVSTTRIAGSGLGACVLFYLVTNFAVWVQGSLYPLTAAGLLECYVAALPFFKNTLLATGGYALALFGTFELAKLRFPVLEPART